MEINISVKQNNDSIYAEAFMEGKVVCTGYGKSPYEAIEDVCTLLSNIAKQAEIEEDEEIINMLREREKIKFSENTCDAQLDKETGECFNIDNEKISEDANTDSIINFINKYSN